MTGHRAKIILARAPESLEHDCGGRCTKLLEIDKRPAAAGPLSRNASLADVPATCARIEQDYAINKATLFKTVDGAALMVR
jgi:hypothetical protein